MYKIFFCKKIIFIICCEKEILPCWSGIVFVTHRKGIIKDFPQTWEGLTLTVHWFRSVSATVYSVQPNRDNIGNFVIIVTYKGYSSELFRAFYFLTFKYWKSNVARRDIIIQLITIPLSSQRVVYTFVIVV